MDFADLKAAFDKVKKKSEMIKNIRVEDYLRKRIMETYEETRNIIKIEDKRMKAFWAGVSKIGIFNESYSI